MLGCSFMSDETVKHIRVRLESKEPSEVRHTGMVRADLECLIASHHKPHFLRLLVLEQPDITSAAFLPLRRVCGKPEEFGAPGRVAHRLIKRHSWIKHNLMAYILNRTSSSSSFVFVSTCSVSLMTGSK